MKGFYLLQGSLTRKLPLLCMLGLTVFLSSCATKPVRRNPRASRPEPKPRSELVFLNIQEASGWVAYDCGTHSGSHSGSLAGSETEAYRVVVIRQKSGEIIYDSQIPLPANLCTHGFEMASDDPRLRRLAQSVDHDIILPLESVRDAAETENAPTPEPAATEPPPPARDEGKPASNEPPPPKTTPDANTPDANTPDATSGGAANGGAAAGPALVISGMDGEAVLLKVNEGEAPVPGTRLFLRSNPTVVAIPGTNETMVTSEGEVTGLVVVQSVNEGMVRARILSGSPPESGYAEKVR